MAGKINSFLSGSNAVIMIGKKRLAYCQNLSFSRDVPLAPVMGVGSYSVHALEPVGYTASGSFQITRYTSELFDMYSKADSTVLPDNMATTKLDTHTNGNSLVDSVSFNPQELLLSYSFDIHVFERLGGDDTGKLIFVFEDCRLESYSFDFTPGSLLTENVSFVCRAIRDALASSVSSSENDTTITLA
jgi:hypothetical protein